MLFPTELTTGIPEQPHIDVRSLHCHLRIHDLISCVQLFVEARTCRLEKLSSFPDDLFRRLRELLGDNTPEIFDCNLAVVSSRRQNLSMRVLLPSFFLHRASTLPRMLLTRVVGDSDF